MAVAPQKKKPTQVKLSFFLVNDSVEARSVVEDVPPQLQPQEVTPNPECDVDMPSDDAGSDVETAALYCAMPPVPPTMPSVPFQPDSKYQFPKNIRTHFVEDKFGKLIKDCKTEDNKTVTKTRSCQYRWFQKWEWLHYDAESDSLFCHLCSSAAYSKDLLPKPNEKRTFVNIGFKRYHNATQCFNKHQKSQAHRNARDKIANLDNTPINELFDSAQRENQMKAYKYLQIVFNCVKFLAQQGFPLRGHDHSDGPVHNMVRDRIETDFPELLHLFEARDNWLSDTVQNEITELFAHAVLRDINTEISESEWVGVVADGTTDCAGNEQFSVCVQYVKKVTLQVENAFMGLYNAPDSTGATLGKIVKDVLLRNGIDLKSKLNGFAFDGASNMSGQYNGAKANIKNDVPNALHVHCANHALDLGLQEVARQNTGIANALQYVKDSSNIIRESSKRRQIYKDNDDDALMLCSICPTRWCVRAHAMNRVLDNYQNVLETLKIIANDSNARGEARAKANGLLKQGLKSDTYFYLCAGRDIFDECELVAKKLQSPSVTAMAASELIDNLKLRLQSLRSDNKFANYLRKNEQATTEFGLEELRDVRAKATPARLRQGGERKDDDILTGEQKLKQSFYQVIDSLSADLDRRFDQMDLKIASCREKLLLNCQLTDDDDCEFTQLSNNCNLPSSLNGSKLKRQLLQFRDYAKAHKCALKSTKDVSELLVSIEPLCRSLYCEVERLLVLILCQPISVAQAERSFSCLRRLKTWLRSTMGQARLTHLAILTIHRVRFQRIVKDSMSNLLRQFIVKSSERRRIFGNQN
jgi:hypothetical protein